MFVDDWYVKIVPSSKKKNNTYFGVGIPALFKRV